MLFYLFLNQYVKLFLHESVFAPGVVFSMAFFGLCEIDHYMMIVLHYSFLQIKTLPKKTLFYSFKMHEYSLCLQEAT